MVKYIARLVAQVFYEWNYVPISSIVGNTKRLSMQLMDIVTVYLYGSLDSDI